MNIDRSYWRQLEHTLTDVETLKKHLEGLKKEAEEPLRKALRQVDELSRLVKVSEHAAATLTAPAPRGPFPPPAGTPNAPQFTHVPRAAAAARRRTRR